MAHQTARLVQHVVLVVEARRLQTARHLADCCPTWLAVSIAIPAGLALVPRRAWAGIA